MTETLEAGDASVTIDHEHGGRLSSLSIAGHEVLVGSGPSVTPMSWGCFPMVPWAGRIRNGRFVDDGRTVSLPLDLPPHAIHGTTYTAAWRPTGAGRLETSLDAPWPWSGTATQEVALSADRLALTLSVTNADDSADAMPISAGWHPWFRRDVGGSAVRIDLPAERMWRRDRDGIPDGTLVDPPPGPWDDCFTALVGPVGLHWPGVLRLYVESDCEHVVVYDEQEAAVCVEPQSAPPDAHNSGEDLVLIEPGETWSITSTWFWQIDPAPSPA